MMALLVQIEVHGLPIQVPVYEEDLLDPSTALVLLPRTSLLQCAGRSRWWAAKTGGGGGREERAERGGNGCVGGTVPGAR